MECGSGRGGARLHLQDGASIPWPRLQSLGAEPGSQSVDGGRVGSEAATHLGRGQITMIAGPMGIADRRQCCVERLLVPRRQGDSQVEWEVSRERAETLRQSGAHGLRHGARDRHKAARGGGEGTGCIRDWEDEQGDQARNTNKGAWHGNSILLWPDPKRGLQSKA